jgi:hypothetical protein
MSLLAAEADAPATPPEAGARLPGEDRRRFTRYALAGTIVGALPAIWLLVVDWWGGVHLFRYLWPNNFYDVQAEAMLHGHLSVPKYILGLEGFVHGGRSYTYFGLFPSLLRIPILVVSKHFAGDLTTVSMLAAWAVIALVTAMLVWRVRVVTRGPVVLGRAEAASWGVFSAAVTGGSILLFLLAAPWVYDEDLMWSVALTLATLFALLGILERPSRGRVWVAGLLILAANLDRAPTGAACVLGALLVAAKFALGAERERTRRWALPVALAGLVPFAVGCAVNIAKFGMPVGFNFAEQVWTQMNAHRRTFLAVNHGRGWNLAFLPTTLDAYLSPVGIHFQRLFPFVTLPTAPPHPIGHVTFDRLYRTASITASMPLLFLLTCWGAFATFRRRASAGARMLRIPLLAAACAPAVTLVWGYIAPRFVADFMPVLILGAIVGLVELWGRLHARPRPLRAVVLAAALLLGGYSMAANLGVAMAPTMEFQTPQVENYAQAVLDVSNLTGHPLQHDVVRTASLPSWAPAGQFDLVGNCAGLYLSTGEDLSTVPEQQAEHRTWLAVEQGPGVRQELHLVLAGKPSRLGSGEPVATLGADTLSLVPGRRQTVHFVVSGKLDNYVSGVILRRHAEAQGIKVEIESDPVAGIMQIQIGARDILLVQPMRSAGPAPVLRALPASPTAPGTRPPVVASVVHLPAPRMPICRSLLAAG